MADVEHSSLGGGANQHAFHRWAVADAAARTALVVSTADVGKIAWQQDDDSFWVLAAATPTWIQLDPAAVAGALTSHTSDVGNPHGVTAVQAGAAASTHASQHKSGGGDVIRLDELAAPTAAVDMNGQDVPNVQISTSPEVADGNSGAAKTIDWGTGHFHKLTLDADVTLTFTAPPGPCFVQLILIQDVSGSHTVMWPASVLWPADTAPTLTTTGGDADLVSFFYDGTNYWAASSLGYSP